MGYQNHLITVNCNLMCRLLSYWLLLKNQIFYFHLMSLLLLYFLTHLQQLPNCLSVSVDLHLDRHYRLIVVVIKHHLPNCW